MNIRTISSIATFSLLLAIFPMPYGYYTLLRLLVFICGLFIAYQFNKSNQTKWAITMGLISLLFNPFIPVYLAREIWLPIDVASAGLFFFVGYYLKKGTK